MSTAVVPAAGGAVARQPKPIRDLLASEQFKSAVQAALPKHLKVERFIRVALNATMRQPDLLQCTQESFFRAMLDLSSYGLEPDGRRAHLIPFRNGKTGQRDVQLIIDYKGLAELVRRSGDVSYMHADVVYESDEFDYAYGSGAFLKHKPDLAKRGTKDSGRRVAFYSFVKLRDGNEDFVILGPGEVDAVRRRSKAADSGPWVTDYDEMGKKTAFRRHSKWLPLSPEVKDAVDHGDDVIDVAGIDVPDGVHYGTAAEQEDVAARRIAQLEGETAEQRDARLEQQMAEQAETAENPPVAEIKPYTPPREPAPPVPSSPEPEPPKPTPFARPKFGGRGR